MAKTTQTITPTELATEIGVDPKRVRAYLRANFARKPEAKNTSWMLDASVAKDVKDHFAKAKTVADNSDES